METLRMGLAVTAATAILSACSADSSSVISPLDGSSVLSVESAKVCETVDFDDPTHLSAISQVSVALAGGFDLTLSVLNPGATSQAQTYVYDTNTDGGPDPDLESANDCPGCAPLGNVLIIGHNNTLNTEGDSPTGGTIVFTGFPGTGTTTIESWVAVDQEAAENSITLEIDDNPIAPSSSGLGDGSVETIVPSTTPAITSEAEFTLDGSGAVDNVQICHIPDDPDNPGTGTPGFWKNHPEAWPNTLTVGGVLYDPATDAIDIMDMPSRGDKTFNLFEQYVAALLNVGIGNDASCIISELAAAEVWLTTYPVGSGVRANSDAWQTEGGSDLLSTFDQYNNGLLCAPSRDD